MEQGALWTLVFKEHPLEQRASGDHPWLLVCCQPMQLQLRQERYGSSMCYQRKATTT